MYIFFITAPFTWWNAVFLPEGSKKRLEDFKYEDKEFAQLIYQNMKRTSFTGVRGNISFDENHDVIGMVKIERVQGRFWGQIAARIHVYR